MYNLDVVVLVHTIQINLGIMQYVIWMAYKRTLNHPDRIS